MRAVAWGAAAAFALHFGGAALKYVIHVLLAQWMGTEDFGRYAYSMAWINVLAVCGGLGLSMGVLRFLPEYVVAGDWEHAAGLVSATRWLTVAAGIIAATSYYVIVTKWDGAAHSLSVLLLVPATSFVTLQAELLRSQRRIELAYFPTLVMQQLLVIGVVLLLLRWQGYVTDTQAIWAHAIGAVCIAGVQIALMRATLPAALVTSAPRYRTGEWLQVSAPMLLATIFTLLLGQSDILMLGAMRGSVEAGLYSASARSAALVGLALVAGNAIVAPMIAGHYARGDMTALMQAVRAGTRLALCGSLVLALFLTAFGRQVLAWFGTEYVGGYGALVVLCAGQVVSAGAGPVGYLLSLTGHERTTARVYGICAIINIVASAMLIRRWGSYGAALATAGSMILWNFWLRCLVRSRLGVGAFLTGGG